ncbi:hypothetical protein HGRIS_014660 [Hohenbuehelia grisea]|uniref:glucan 1,3-beta-glucosidase n=1 Tax=Hohenbuehelia grisea TaxID=104357 RepID=A0ABR3JUE5_9AGAR
MAQPNANPHNVDYESLPLNAQGLPPSPQAPYYNPPQLGQHGSPSEVALTDPTVQTRFLGAARYDEPGGYSPRDSFASSHRTGSGNDLNSEYAGSAYALNPLSSRTNPPYRDYGNDGYESDHDQMNAEAARGGRRNYLAEKQSMYGPPKAKSSRKVIILAIIAAIILLALAVGIPLYFAVFKPKSKDAAPEGTVSPESKDVEDPIDVKPVSALVTGGDGSTVTLDDGSTMVYRNRFGGHWYYDENDPYNNGARAQAWTPALNETFNYGVDKMRGVNLGGWLNTEPFIVPALYEKYVNTSTVAVDEWTLSLAMRADTAGGGINQLEEHYKTFITERDFAEIADAGLNYVRIPIGYWAVEVKEGEPFFEKVSWTYFLKAIKWARKYGLRINLDLHAVPGSQNPWNHSGRRGQANFLNGPMGLANAQRTLDIIRVIAEFISQDQYKDVVTMFGIMNEPRGPDVGEEQLSRFYLESYNIIRRASGVGEGKGPIISFHDGFWPLDRWANFLPQADRIAMDAHKYLAFNDDQFDQPMSAFATAPCSAWGAEFNASMGTVGLTGAGEWSNAINDCGLYLNEVDEGARYEGRYRNNGRRVGSCETWTDWTRYSASMKNDIKQFAMASMDAFQNYFFWTWKIGNSSVSGRVQTPAWSYQLGLHNGWMPQDPREADGVCGNIAPWLPPLRPWQTGGAGAGQIPAAVTSSLAWPPPSIINAGAASLLPTYVPTGVIPTLTAPTPTGSSMTARPDPGNGWANPGDTAGYMTEAAGCSYLDPWVGPTGQIPVPLCTAAARRNVLPAPEPTHIL